MSQIMAQSSALSEEEFQRLQNQLLDLKSCNYTLEEQNRRYNHENNNLKLKCDDLEKSLSRAQTVAKINPLSIARNLANKMDNKLRETSNEMVPSSALTQLVTENEKLHHRLESQEQEFRITNDTLKSEILQLTNANEQLIDRVKHLEDEYIIIENQLKNNKSPVKGQSRDSVINDSVNDPLGVSIAKVTPLVEPNHDIGTVTDDDTNHKGIDAEQLSNENESLKLKITELRTIINDLRKENALISAQFEEINDKCSKLSSIEDQLNDVVKLSEERSVMINDLRENIEFNERKYKDDVQLLRNEYEIQIDDLRSQLSHSRDDNEMIKNDLIEANDKLKQLSEIRNENEKLTNELFSYKEELDFCKVHSEEVKSQMESEHEKQIRALNEEHNSILIQLRNESDHYQMNIEQLENEIKNLNQQIFDSIEERKIHDKKGVAIVKELKRQLHTERKRADKLQEKFQELLNESTSTISAEIRKQNLSGGSNNNGNNDSSSVGSWSFMSNSAKDGNNRRTSSIHSDSDGRDAPQTPSFSPINENESFTHHSPLEQENSQLVTRVTLLQQEKWILEEKINHLEVSNSAMAEDILRKTQIIQYYSMEGRSDPPSAHSSHNDVKITVKRVVDFIKDKGDENMREINRKVQRMLEETLTKNMHLQQNLETLSDEVMRLNKIIQMKECGTNDGI